MDIGDLHPYSEFIANDEDGDRPPTYWYEGRCPHSGKVLRLPRTVLAEAIARGLMRRLARDAQNCREGKMYGILLVELPSGEQRVLQAFSGLLNGNSTVVGWVPPIPGHDQVALVESHILAQITAIQQALMALHHLAERQQYNILCREFEQHLQEMGDRHRDRKQHRHQQRQLLSTTQSGAALTRLLEQLDEESRQDGIERRHLKRQHHAALQPLQQIINQADAQIRQLKQQRKDLSRQLQTQMHTAYWLTNFAGESLSLHQLMPGGSMPTGTGDCCAPKLLHYAATHRLKPLAMAEFWWGGDAPGGDKVQGEFYGACAERCQPLMGFLLSGLSQLPTPIRTPYLQMSGSVQPLVTGELRNGEMFLNVKPKVSRSKTSPKLPTLVTGEGQDGDIPILYQDDWILAVNKPAGLLSVPGRYYHSQDCVLNRLQVFQAEGMALIPVHRLDQETSGILVFARTLDVYRHISRQFQQRRVHKVYDALLAGVVETEQGVIYLPLRGNPQMHPYQTVDWQRGKSSITEFRVIARGSATTRVEFRPLTGRTHQIRVHAAHPDGLGVPILGDRLYGNCAKGGCVEGDRLYLHAQDLRLEHPHSGRWLHLQTENSPIPSTAALRPALLPLDAQVRKQVGE